MRHAHLSAALATLGVGLLVASCGSTKPPPLSDPVAIESVSCSAQVQLCVGGVAADQSCLGYGAPQSLGNNGVYDGGCTTAAQCPSNCDTYAKILCVEPQCRLVPNSVSVTSCGVVKNKCGSTSNPPGGQNRPSPGQKVPDDPNAPYRVLSFAFTISPQFVEQNPPTRVTPISAVQGKPVALDISGLVGVLTELPSTFIGYDIATQPPTFAIPPQNLVDILTTLTIAEPQGLLGNAVVGDVVGVSLYDMSPTSAKRTASVKFGPVDALDVDPQFAITANVAVLTSPRTLRTQCFSKKPPQLSLQGEGVDLTMGTSDIWAALDVPTGTTVVRADATSASLLGQSGLSGKPVAIGGASSVDSSIPGAVIILVDTPVGPELHWFLGGALNTAAVVLPLTDFPNATPVGMKVVVIDNVQYAWVALLTGTTNVIALYNLATKTHVKALDVDLNALEPVALTAGLPGVCTLCGSNDSFNGTQTAFLHVLVKTN